MTFSLYFCTGDMTLHDTTMVPAQSTLGQQRELFLASSPSYDPLPIMSQFSPAPDDRSEISYSRYTFVTRAYSAPGPLQHYLVNSCSMSSVCRSAAQPGDCCYCCMFMFMLAVLKYCSFCHYWHKNSTFIAVLSLMMLKRCSLVHSLVLMA